MAILHITRVAVPAPHHLTLQFDDGEERTVDVRPLIRGPVFEPLRDPDYFATVQLDRICGTVVWACGADFAPEALRCLPVVSAASVA